MQVECGRECGCECGMSAGVSVVECEHECRWSVRGMWVWCGWSVGVSVGGAGVRAMSAGVSVNRVQWSVGGGGWSADGECRCECVHEV